jgi:hypothetical protein
MALTECHECGKEISDEAETCPNCGVDVSSGSKLGSVMQGCGCLSTLVVFGVIVATLFSVNGNEGSGGASTSSPSPEPSSEPAVEVVEHDYQTGEYRSASVTGVVRNNSNQTLSYVQVEINLYDGQGTQLGSTLANTNNLEPGGRWRFEAQVIEDGVQRYKIVDVVGR